jgi:predicted signal transduction protein with EAL and GGDEF domain
VARKILDGLLQSYELEGAGSLRVSASIGISVFPDDADDAAMLVKNADKAMYAAKQAGKSGYRFFPAPPAEASGARATESALSALAGLSAMPRS